MNLSTSSGCRDLSREEEAFVRTRTDGGTAVRREILLSFFAKTRSNPFSTTREKNFEEALRIEGHSKRVAHCCAIIERGAIGASLPGIGARPRQERIREEHGNRFETAVNCAVVRVGMRRRLGSKVFVAGTCVPRPSENANFYSARKSRFRVELVLEGAPMVEKGYDPARLFRYDEIITR